MRNVRSFNLRRWRFVSILVVAIVGVMLVSCGSASANSGSAEFNFPKLIKAGPITKTIDVQTDATGQSKIGSSTNPDLNSFGPIHISSSGTITSAQQGNSNSHIFSLSNPTGKWQGLGAIPGKVTQLDFVSSEIGYALVQQRNVFGTLLLYRTTNSGASWVKVSEGNFVKVHFFSTNAAVAVAPTSNVSIGGPGISIEFTSNGGKTWSLESPPSLSKYAVFTSQYTSFSFISKQVGWLAVGGQPSAGSQMKALFKTADGGKNWSVVGAGVYSRPGVTQPKYGFPVAGYLEQIKFINSSVGYLACSRGGRGSVLETTDGGKTWHGKQLLPANSFISTSIKTFEPNTKFGSLAVTQQGEIWQKKNSTFSWTKIFPPYNPLGVSYDEKTLEVATVQGRLLKVDTSNTSNYAVQKNFGDNIVSLSQFANGEAVVTDKYIALRQNGGTWIDSYLPNRQKIIYGKFLNGSFGLVSQSPISKTIDATSDGGKKWSSIPFPFYPYSMDPLSQSDWWVIGVSIGPLKPNPYPKEVTVSKYALYHTTNAGRSWTKYVGTWGASGYLYGVEFATKSMGYLWTGNHVLVTKDAGKTFTDEKFPNNIELGGPASISVEPNGSAWMTTGNYPLYKTVDFAKTWSTVN